MQNWKKIALGVAALLLCWHVIIAMTPRIRLAGLFLAKPADPGYVWTDADHSDSRLFWQNTTTKWLIGAAHPNYQAEAAQQEGVWNPMPGYAFADKSKGLNTIWKQSLKHPDYMAWSDEVEGKWIPVTGYKFIYEGSWNVNTSSGLRSHYARRGHNGGRDARLFLGGVATGVLLRSL